MASEPVEILVAEGMLRKIGTLATGVTPKQQQGGQGRDSSYIKNFRDVDSRKNYSNRSATRDNWKIKGRQQHGCQHQWKHHQKKDVNHRRDTSNTGTTTIAGTPTTTGMSEMLETQVAESTSATAGLAATESLLPELQGSQSTATDDKSWDPTRKVLLPWIQMPCPGLEPVSV
jgi:hypothetical protein